MMGASMWPMVVATVLAQSTEEEAPEVNPYQIDMPAYAPGQAGVIFPNVPEAIGGRRNEAVLHPLPNWEWVYSLRPSDDYYGWAVPVGRLGMNVQHTQGRLGQKTRFCTAFLLGAETIMTAMHCLQADEEGFEPVPETMKLAMNVLEKYYQPDLFAVEDQPLEVGEGNLDYALLRVYQRPERVYGQVRLSDAEAPDDDSTLFVVHHPDGDPKRITRRQCKTDYLEGELLQHTCDTRPGSSGAPVFDRAGKVVGVHVWGGDPELGRPNTAVQLAAIVQRSPRLRQRLEAATSDSTPSAASGPSEPPAGGSVAPDGVLILKPGDRYVGLRFEGIRIVSDEILMDVTLRASDFQFSSFVDLEFGQGVDLTGANLMGAEFRAVVTHSAEDSPRALILRGADLTGADLRVADLRGADLRKAKLTGADLRGALLPVAPWLRGAIVDSDTRLPLDFVHWGHGLVDVEFEGGPGPVAGWLESPRCRRSIESRRISASQIRDGSLDQLTAWDSRRAVNPATCEDPERVDAGSEQRTGRELYWTAQRRTLFGRGLRACACLIE